ncbi:MAG: hypothetical protein QOC54_1405, partial [Baekduia sp.]|nr:hypothetical protein [Baekduia sp.]
MLEPKRGSPVLGVSLPAAMTTGTTSIAATSAAATQPWRGGSGRRPRRVVPLASTRVAQRCSAAASAIR